MSYEKAAAMFQVSRSSVGRILAEEKRKHGDEALKPQKKRGQKSPLSIEALIHLLFDSTLTLKQVHAILWTVCSWDCFYWQNFEA